MLHMGHRVYSVFFRDVRRPSGEARYMLEAMQVHGTCLNSKSASFDNFVSESKRERQRSSYQYLMTRWVQRLGVGVAWLVISGSHRERHRGRVVPLV